MFRRVRYSDLDRVREIFIAAFREEYGRRGVDIGAQVSRWKRAYPLLKLLAQFPNPYRYALNLHVWEEDGCVLGFIMTSPGNRERTRWHIDFVAVAPDTQGRGLGARLVEGVFDTYGACGVKLFTLEVDQDNGPALRFYDKLGFRRYASVTYYTREAPPVGPSAPTSGFRPMVASDAAAVFEMHAGCLPAAVRHIDSRTCADFAWGPSERAVARLRRALGHQDDQRWVLEEGGRPVAWVRVLAQLRPLPHTVHLLTLPGQEHQHPRLLEKAAEVLAAFPPRQVLAWASDHTPAKQQALLDWGMAPLTVDHSLVRDSLITIKLPAHGQPAVGLGEDTGFKPCFTQRS
jgi:GNAT superfamily N-acetyltransferase